MLKYLSAFVVVAVFASAAFSGEDKKPEKPNPKAPSEPKPKAPEKKKLVAKRDPGDQPYRRAPMKTAPRSIVVPIDQNIHLCFDTETLCLYGIWIGPSLSLYGPPYTANSTRFYCDFEGENLWEQAPLYPWGAGAIPEKEARVKPDGARFRAISTKGKTTLSYDVSLGDGKSVRVQESFRLHPIDRRFYVVRRMEIAPCDKDLYFMAHTEIDTVPGKAPTSAATTLMRKNGSGLLALAFGVAGLEWKTADKEVDYSYHVFSEEKDNTTIKDVRVKGREGRAWLKIPAHAEPVCVEVYRRNFTKDDTDDKLQSEIGGLAKLPVIAPKLDYIWSKEPPLEAPPAPTVVSATSTQVDTTGSDAVYSLEHFPLPKEIDPLVGGMDFLPDGNLAMCTWGGEMYIVEKPQGSVNEAKYRRYARGLCEPLGVKMVNGEMYIVQKPELTKIVDTDGNGEADLYVTVNDAWGFTGNYHSFAFGPELDKDGNFCITINAHRGHWEFPFNGWMVKISPDGAKCDGVASGLRSPNGILAYGPDRDIFGTDNQGNFIGACRLNHLQQGQFYGHPSTAPAPKEDMNRVKPMLPPAVWFPKGLSSSASGMAVIPEGFGPFTGQILAGEFQYGSVTRIALEKVNGQWQGCVWPFLRGFYSGVNRLSFGPDKKLYVGGCKRRWACPPPREYSLERVTFNSQPTFDVHSVKALKDGFELTFTQPVDKELGNDAESFSVEQFNYEHHPGYGSDIYDHNHKQGVASEIEVVSAKLSDDALKITVTMKGLREGFVTGFKLDLQNTEKKPLREKQFWYTLNQFPK